MKTYEIRLQRLNEMPHAPTIDGPSAVVAYWHEVISKMPWFIPDREICVVITLNTRHRVTGHSLVSLGTLNESLVHPRDVFRAAVALNAYAVILTHNHPSGDSSPSAADQRITRQIDEAAHVLQISLADHIIIGSPDENRTGYFSFKEAGVI